MPIITQSMHCTCNTGNYKIFFVDSEFLIGQVSIYLNSYTCLSDNEVKSLSL